MKRTVYGYPDAHAYAAAARERNKPTCACDNCQQIEALPKVQRLTSKPVPPVDTLENLFGFETYISWEEIRNA